jgi:pimeloyl-ACP methyl ester carboxylesterase
MRAGSGRGRRDAWRGELGRFLLGLAALAAAHGAAAQAPDASVEHPDYAQPGLWLCRPDLPDNRCEVDLDATVIAPSGKMTLERHVPAKDPRIDCFFVYPTVSNDPGWQADFSPDKMEWDDIKLQFARFGAVCRQFAPLYRQGTLRGLRASSGGPPPVGERPPPGFGGFTDVVDAWSWYMAHENQGRGVVLIGHSQGGAMITRLIAQEIDGKPVQKQLISALVLGAPVMVPPGKDVGGSFKTIALCRADTQTGCVISYSTFRDRLPPPANSRFGRARDGLRVACVNPANLAGGAGKPSSYFLTKGFLNGSGGGVQPDWVRPARPIATSFVATPGLISTQCVETGEFDYLSLHVNADPADPRTDELAGQIIRSTGVDPSWGLHLLDVDHSMGSLIRIVREQARAYERSKIAD